MRERPGDNFRNERTVCAKKMPTGEKKKECLDEFYIKALLVICLGALTYWQGYMLKNIFAALFILLINLNRRRAPFSCCTPSFVHISAFSCCLELSELSILALEFSYMIT